MMQSMVSSLPMDQSDSTPKPYPILLAHGVARFDVLLNGSVGLDNQDDPVRDNLHYFKGIRTVLREAGHDVWHCHVPWAASVQDRAAAMKEQIRTLLQKRDAAKVHIIGHSMGGLDARHMMFNDRNESDPIHHAIASLNTISTPHAGSPFADWGLANRRTSLLVRWLSKLGLNLEALQDLTVRSAERFNADPEVIAFEENCLSEGIRFRTYAGYQKKSGIFVVLRPSWQIIEDYEKDLGVPEAERGNDGLVSLISAQWRPAYFQERLPNTDHLNQCGWWEIGQLLNFETRSAFEARIRAFYLRLAETISSGN